MKNRGAEPSAASESLADDIVGVTEYKFSLPKKKEFKPWHKPRKQFVRKDQWGYLIGELLDELAQPDGTLTYFGLPGDDLLDLRFFGETVCEPRNLKLRFLGFNNSDHAQQEDKTELYISLDEVNKSASVDPKSEIAAYDVRDLVDATSVAWHLTWDIGPYDVINLDLCDGFGNQPPGKFNQTYYDMVSRLLAVQARRKAPWLLLLTTRVGKDHVHSETLKRLADIFNQNLTDCASFLAASSENFDIFDPASLKSAATTEIGIQRIFLTGICKWLLRLTGAQNPPSIAEVKSVMGYRVYGGAEVQDMISIGIRFSPTAEVIADPSNLASIKPTSIDECSLATKALKRVQGLFDVDEYLSTADDIRQEMLDEMCALLEAARYDIDEYRRSPFSV